MNDSPGKFARGGMAAPSAFGAISVTLLLAGCAPTPAPETAQAAVAPAFTETRACRPDPALLTPQSAPDCKFGRHALKTLDPYQWARLKVEYERQCYQRAERKVRDRLRLLQAAASRC